MPPAKRKVEAPGPLTVAVSSNDKRVRRKASSSARRRPRIEFLKLPPELRTEVYQIILEDILAPPDHIAWDPLPQHSRFETYLSLMLTSRQVRNEFEELFNRPKNLSRLTFYYDDAVDVYDFQPKASKYPLLRNAKVCIRSTIDRPAEDRLVRDNLEKLIICQPNLPEPPDDLPSLYSMKIYDWSQGVGDHSTCSQNGEHSPCYYYKTLKWPVLGNNMQITNYQWRCTPQHLWYRDESADESTDESTDSEPNVRASVMTGRLCDLSFKKFPIDTARAAKAERDLKIEVMDMYQSRQREGACSPAVRRLARLCGITKDGTWSDPRDGTVLDGDDASDGFDDYDDSEELLFEVMVALVIILIQRRKRQRLIERLRTLEEEEDDDDDDSSGDSYTSEEDTDVD